MWEVPGHIPRIESAGIIGPQPVLRQADDVLAEDLRIALEGEGTSHLMSGYLPIRLKIYLAILQRIQLT